MANLDVTELMSDPDFVSPFTVTRQGQLIDSFGRRGVSSTRKQKIFGSIQPVSARTMEVQPNLTNVSGAIEIWTQFRLEGPSTTTEADTVTWNGNDYVVVNVESFTNFGRGYVHAIAQLRDLLAASPATSVTDTGP